MQQIQISRGKLNVRRGVEELLNGELFIDYTRGKRYDSTDANSYELFAGVNGQTIKLGGQGVLSFIRATDEELDGDGLPKKPVTGGIYYISKDIQLKSDKDSSGKDTPEFRAGDLAVYVGEELHDSELEAITNRFGGTFDEAPGWVRINNGGGDAYEVTFNPDNTNFQETTTNVQAALVEIDRTKLAYGGIKVEYDATAGAVDLNGNDVIDKDLLGKADANGDYTISKEDFFKVVKAGYYYSIGTIPAGSKVKIQLVAGENSETEDKFIELEEGDFVAVTSKVTSNDVPLTASDVTLTKIAGGTHDADRINYTAGGRNKTYKDSTDTAWDEIDGGVDSVRDALDDLFVSKADLTKYGKIPLTQLPDTLINSMEFQGSYVVTNLADGKPDFKLPTAADIVTRNDEDTEKELVQGDYWIYSGPQIKISDYYNDGELESSEGFLNSGDWLVYNGDNWAVIDNTSPIKSISLMDDFHTNEDGELNRTEDVLTQETLDGNITFTGSSREHGTGTIKEVELGTDHVGTISIHSTNAALIETEAAPGYIYKEDGDKVLVKTGLYEKVDGEDSKLVIDENNGITFTGAIPATDATPDKDVDDILDANLAQNPNQVNNGDINILLPAHSGTLATLDDVGLEEGTAFFIPRFKEKDNNLILADSPIELIDHEEDDKNGKLIGLTFHTEIKGKNDSTNGSALGNNASIIFRCSEDNKSDSLQVMPEYSGFVLNSNSIIDCGEWTESGLVMANEGKQNLYFNRSFDITHVTYYNGIKSGEIPANGSVEDIKVIVTE